MKFVKEPYRVDFDKSWRTWHELWVKLGMDRVFKYSSPDWKERMESIKENLEENLKGGPIQGWPPHEPTTKVDSPKIPPYDPAYDPEIMKSIMEKLKGGQIYQARPSYDPFEWNWDTPTQARSDTTKALYLSRIYEPGHPDTPTAYISVPTVWAIPGILGSTTEHHHVMVPPDYVPGTPFMYVKVKEEVKDEVKEALDKAMEMMFEPKKEDTDEDIFEERKPDTDAKLAIRLLRDLAGGSCPHCGAPVFPDAHQCKKCFHTFEVEKRRDVKRLISAWVIMVATSLFALMLPVSWVGVALVCVLWVCGLPVLHILNEDCHHVPVPFKEYRRVHDRVMKRCARQRRKAERAARKIRDLERRVSPPETDEVDE